MKTLLERVEQEVANRNISEPEISKIITSIPPLINRRIIAGYASASIIDRENQKISLLALHEAVKRFMSEDKYRIISIFHCLTPETKVLTCRKGNTYLPISEINVGDKVYTHTGNLRKVTKVFEHDVNAPILEITLSNGEVINVTDEHPILTRDRGWIKAGRLTTNDILLHCSPESLKNAAKVSASDNSFDNLIPLCRSCHSFIENQITNERRKELTLVNGTKILSINWKWYTGKVYNLEVEIDHTYAGKGLIYHNSDAVVGRVLPRWTDPETGKIYKTEVDNIGWKIVCELRDDIELSDKVWSEILKGNLRSFSVAGTSKRKHENISSGRPFQEIDELDLLEVTICLPEDQKIWTIEGLKDVQNVTTNDIIYTHNGRWKNISKVMIREVDEHLVKITTNAGHLIATKEHPIIAMSDTTKSSVYQWTPACEINTSDLMLYNKFQKFCQGNEVPVFIKNQPSYVINVELVPYKGKVYNFSIPEDESYATEFAIVHNCSVPVNPLSQFDILWEGITQLTLLYIHIIKDMQPMMC